MTKNWNIIGHKKQIEFLNRAIEHGKIAHAYVFNGPEGVGKRTLALNFAQILLCENLAGCNNCPQCKSLKHATNADLVEINGQGGIKIEQIRELIYKLALKPYLAKYKIAVIDDAQEMTLEASNALLKGLEEPKPYTVFILVTANAFRLPKTILSRVQKINFGLVPNSEYEHLFSDKLSFSQKKLVSSFATGRPGLALRISTDQGFLEILEKAAEDYKKFTEENLVEKLKLAANLADQERLDLKMLIDFWLVFVEEGLKAKPNTKNALTVRLLAEARRFLESNVNSKLILTNLILQSSA